MENKDIINFSKFFGDFTNPKLSSFSKEDFKDFFINEEEEPKEEKKAEVVKDIPEFDPPVDIEQFVIDEEEPEETDFEDSLGSYDNEHNYTKVKENVENYFAVYKDKTESFSCDVSVEGAKISETKARLILESDDWTLMFEGDIDRNGKCNIPIKKLNILEEGSVGKIRLEVIAENTVFTPWEDDFKVKVSKKVTVQFNESKYNKKPERMNESKVKVNVKR
jgi:hypothetical protein